MAILHRTRSLSALMPRYTERFRCTGPACEDTCCVGWPVHIDKKTYKAYRQQTHPAIAPVISLMKRIEHSSSDTRYALLPLTNPDGYCPAQKDGLCTVHAALGESYLSDTCQNYPRVNRRVNGQQEQSLSLSCSEAARLALLHEDAFEFTEAPVSVRDGTVYNTTAAGRMSAEQMSEVRIFCLNLMRTREFALWQRLALLGVFCEALDRYRASDAQDGGQLVIADFMQVIEDGELLAALDLIQPNYDAQAMVFATLWGLKGFAGFTAFQETQVRHIAAGLGADASGQVSGNGLVAAYRRGLERLDQALQATPWMLEHYLLNEMFTQLFPVEGGDAYEAYLRLVARFGLLRLLLAARCNNEDELPTPAALASVVALQCRRFQHDPQYTDHVNLSLRSSGWADLNKLYTLVRN